MYKAVVIYLANAHESLPQEMIYIMARVRYTYFHKL